MSVEELYKGIDVIQLMGLSPDTKLGSRGGGGSGRGSCRVSSVIDE